MNIASYKDAVKYLESFIGKIVFKIDRKAIGEHDPLERMRILLSLLGNPQDNFKSVLVGGTSGKGSTAYLISHILKTSGHKTGLALSPHLQKVNERIQVNEKEISNEKFTEIVASTIQIIEKMKGMKFGAPSYFEILVGMAFKYFADQKVDIAVVEVGMGGEFDATNTLNPLIAVLTNVGLDHTKILGNTVEKIAKTKAGIIKKLKVKNEKLKIDEKELIVVTGVKQPSVVEIIENKCREVGARLLRLGKDFGLMNYKVSLLGDYQKENASLAIKVISELKKFGFKISDEAIKKALSTAFFPGRFEIINYTLDAKRYTLILDGAHNPTKVKEFLKSLEKIFPKEKKIFIVGFKFDKDIPKMLKQIVKIADEIIITEFKAKTDTNLHASADAKSIKYKALSMKYRGKVVIEKDSAKALKMGIKAIQQSNNLTILVVTGSLYLVGEIRNKLC